MEGRKRDVIMEVSDSETDSDSDRDELCTGRGLLSLSEVTDVTMKTGPVWGGKIQIIVEYTGLSRNAQ